MSNNLFSKLIKGLLFLFLIILNNNLLFSQTGSCASPNAKFFTVTEGTWSQDKGNDFSNCMQTLTEVGGKIKTYHTVKSSADGTLGFIQNIAVTDATCQQQASLWSSRQTNLYAVGNCGGTTIPYDQLITNTNYSSTFNPQWTNLTPSTDYIVETIITVPSACSSKIDAVCLDIYYPKKTSCTASAGTISVTGGISKGSNEYDLTTNGATITISSSGSVLPSPSTVSTGSTATYGFFVFTQQPTLPFADVSPTAITALPGFKGVVSGTSISDDNLNGVSKSITGATTLWFIPAVFDKKQNGLTLDDDGDGCYAVGTPIKVNYSVVVTPPTCSTCATATCKVTSITAPTLPKGRTDITTALASAGDQYGGLLLVPDESATICVPVKVPQGSTALGFKMKTTASPGGCGNPAEQIVTYELKPVGCGTKINPTRTNAQPVLSGFNPEWDNIAPGDYILCFTMKADPMMFCSTIEINGLGYYNVGAVCPADNGSQAVKINNATPPATKAYATNSYGLCFNDVFSITTTNANPSVDYAIYIGAPTSNNPATESTKYTGDFKLNLNQLSETSTGNTSPVLQYLNTTTFKPTNNTIWWVPISTNTVGMYDPTCYNMDFQNESYKVTYLNDIKITGTEVCASSKVTLKFEGGAPEFISGKKYNITTNKGTLSASSLATSGGTIDLTGLSKNDSYTISVTDEIGCVKTFTGTYSCACTPPTILGTTSICEGTTAIDWKPTSGVTWSSSDATVASVSTGGTLSGYKAGTVTITATDNTTQCTATKQVTVNPKPSISGTLTVCEGSTTTLTGTGSPATTSPWVSATTTNATVSNTGVVTGVTGGNGTSEITYTDNKGCTAKATVTVNPILFPTVTCGTSTATSVTFTWGAVTGATTYDIVYNINNGGDQTKADHPTTTYPVPNVPAGKSVTIIVTPKGTGCFKASTIKSCTADNCPTPSITQEPTSLSKCDGSSASFSITATSTATLSYQWQINNGAGTPTNITNTGVYTGATSSTLSISDVKGLNGTKYQCLVTESSSGTGCNKTSVVATLTVNPIPSFTPSVSDICEGSDPSLTYTNLTGSPDRIVLDPNLPLVSPINISISPSPIVVTGLPIKLPVNTYSGLKVRLENTVTGCKSTDFTIASFKVQATQTPSISSKGTDVSSVTFQWSDLTGLNTQTGAKEDSYIVEEFVCTSNCTSTPTSSDYKSATGVLSYNTSTSKWEYLKNNLQPGDKVFIKVTPKDNLPLAIPSCYNFSVFDLTAVPCNAPVITKDLADVTICEGTTANPVSTSFDLEYNSADNTSPLTWEFLTPGGTWKPLTISGVYSLNGTTNSSTTLSISDVKGLDGVKYRVSLKTATVGGSCNILSKEVLLTVKPLPTMISVADKSFCPGTLVNDPLKPKDFDFKVSQAGAPTFTWKSDLQTTGVKLEGINANDGTKNVSEFESFTTSNPLIDAVSIVTVIPTLNQCVGQPITFKITVKPTIKPVNFVAVPDFNNVKFTWSSSSILPDFWDIDTAITSINAPQPTTAQYKNVGLPQNLGTKQDYTVAGINSSKKAYIIVTPKQDPSKTDLFCPASDGFGGIPTPCTKPSKPADPIVNPVCEGVAITVNGVNNDLNANFQWKISTDAGVTWNNVSFTDFGSTGTTNILSTQVTKSYMNNALVKVVLTDKQTGQCTEESNSVKLTVNELPNVKLIQPTKTSLCIDDNDVSAFVQPVIGKSPLKIDYTLNGVTSTNQDITNLEIKFSAKNEMNYSLSISRVIDANNCESLLTGLTSLVTIHKNPTPNFAVSDTIGCYPLKINFTDISGEKFTDVTWDFGTGTNSSKDLGTTTFTYQKQGDYTVTYSVVNEYGCVGEVIKKDKIHVKNSPKAVVSTDRNVINVYENVVQFSSKLSQNGSFYKWDFGDNSSFSNDPIVKHKYDPTLPGKYKVLLIVSNSSTNTSCSDTAVTWIDFPEEVVYFIPNTFTPNGDEFNNTFQPIFTSGYDPQNYLFTIYDRWGQVVFESKNPTVGWDGTYGDKLLGNDTFVWKLGFKEKATDNEHHTTGHVNLVK